MRKAFYALFALLMLFIILIGIHQCNEMARERRAIQLYSGSVYKYSFMYGVDANLVLAVIKVESDFDENAISSKGAVGLMQLLPSTALFVSDKLGVEFSEEDLFDSDINIRFGTYYLSYLFDKFATLETVLAAYNAGEGNVSRWLSLFSDDGKTLRQIPFEETERFVSRVRFHFDRYRKDYNY
jgi:soluble lytic murein transglycosylase